MHIYAATGKMYLLPPQNGQTALSIAQRLGYISVVDTLEGITEVTETVPASDDKYKVVSPETMQETFLSDSEDEGGDYLCLIVMYKVPLMFCLSRNYTLCAESGLQTFADIVAPDQTVQMCRQFLRYTSCICLTVPSCTTCHI